ncbi:hypothetical protein NP590_01090 [Methylomonas sp. SURF-2]|uniref:Uncharacterized protein n=1 Tax=Methylomonas subterranea TaxID=2952225 RepID=A0ABT1TB60_9GAMM|nr:hypothetical protein [Methylomonas sp. SURF-2]MCQ8102683.1 hypothetical protein [Methylomonas sp. SURF-2]
MASEIRRSARWLLSFSALLVTSTLSHANPLADYCITKQGQKPPPVKFEHPVNSPQQPPETIEIEFTVKNDLYRLRSERSDVTLYDAANQTLGKVIARQRDGGSIEHLQLVAEDLLWIKGSKMDYLVRLDLKQSPIRFGALEAIDLTPKPYSKIEKFFFAPDYRSHGQYSWVLNRLFITGHRTTLFGTADPVATEWVNGQAKPLPEELYDTELDTELPQLNGVLFRGRGVQGDELEAYNKAVFYDGVKATRLLEGYLDKEVKYRGWSVHIAPISKRVFLSNANGNKPFLVELKASSKEIMLPNNLSAGFGVYELPEKRWLLLAGYQDLAIEIDNEWRSIIHVTPPSKITRISTSSLFTEINEIVITIDNQQTKNGTNYFLVNSSSKTNCFATLDPDKPIELKVE